MKIYENVRAGYKCYFVKTSTGGDFAFGTTLAKVHNKWELSDSHLCREDLKDESHYPLVGNINLNKVIIEAILSAIENGVKKK